VDFSFSKGGAAEKEAIEKRNIKLYNVLIISLYDWVHQKGDAT
jgi:hypothetical protein